MNLPMNRHRHRPEDDRDIMRGHRRVNDSLPHLPAAAVADITDRINRLVRRPGGDENAHGGIVTGIESDSAGQGWESMYDFEGGRPAQTCAVV
jgi:hypothetical protein